MPQQPTRQTIAIMFTDLCGYSAWMQRDEAQALAMLRTHWDLLRPVFASFDGREIKTIGDAFLIEFPSALQAVRAGTAMLNRLADYNRQAAQDQQIRIRIGIHLGDVERIGADVFGDGVNIASRIEPLAPPGGMCISESVYAIVQNKVPIRFYSLGVRQLKNISQPVTVYSDSPVSSPAFIGTPRRTWIAVACAVALAAAALLAGRAFIQIPAQMPSAPVLAVLPFENLGSEQGNSAITAGLHDTLITRVAKISGMTVISRTSVMAYKDRRGNLKEVARALGVTHVLEGSVQRAGERVQIQAQLIDAVRDATIWAESFDRTLAQGFATQNEIAADIARELAVRLTDRERSDLSEIPSGNADAFEQYVLGHAEIVRGDYQSAITHLQRALELDPGFDLALAEISIAHTHAGDADASHSESHRAQARESYEEALRRNPRMPEAILARGVYHYARFDADYSAIADDFEQAVALLPNDHLAFFFLGVLRKRQGNWTESARLLERAAIIEPTDISTLENLINVYSALRQRAPAVRAVDHAQAANPDSLQPHFARATLLRDFDGDIKACIMLLEKLRAQHPHDAETLYRLAEAYSGQGRYDAAAHLFTQAAGRIDLWPGLVELQAGWAYLDAGDRGNARHWFGVSLAIMEQSAAPGSLVEIVYDKLRHAYVMAGLGEHEKARDLLDSALQTVSRERDLVTWSNTLTYASLLLARLGEQAKALTLLEQLMLPPGMVLPYGIWYHWGATGLRADPVYRPFLQRHGLAQAEAPSP